MWITHVEGDQARLGDLVQVRDVPSDVVADAFIWERDQLVFCVSEERLQQCEKGFFPRGVSFLREDPMGEPELCGGECTHGAHICAQSSVDGLLLAWGERWGEFGKSSSGYMAEEKEL